MGWLMKITAEEILDATLRGSTDYRHRSNPKRVKIIHIDESWALQWKAGSSYGCGYGPTYVSGCVDLVLIPEGLRCNHSGGIWDTGRDGQGAMTAKKLARVIEVVSEEIKSGRDEVERRVRNALLKEFPLKRMEVK